jgi:hypothetical protein
MLQVFVSSQYDEWWHRIARSAYSLYHRRPFSIARLYDLPVEPVGSGDHHTIADHPHQKASLVEVIDVVKWDAIFFDGTI